MVIVCASIALKHTMARRQSQRPQRPQIEGSRGFGAAHRNFGSKEARAQIHAIGREEQRDHQTDAAEYKEAYLEIVT